LPACEEKVRGGTVKGKNRGRERFPGGVPRFIQRSIGYKATIVNGKVNVLVGERSGICALS
jgi:hypothetical protein